MPPQRLTFSHKLFKPAVPAKLAELGTIDGYRTFRAFLTGARALIVEFGLTGRGDDAPLMAASGMDVAGSLTHDCG